MVTCRFRFIFFFFKQKTAYEMRISDWSSDVCSSDLSEATRQRDGLHAILDLQLFEDVAQMPLHGVGRDRQAIGQIFVAEAVREKAQQAALLLAEAGDQFRKIRVDIGERGRTAFASLGQQTIEMQLHRVRRGLPWQLR